MLDAIGTPDNAEPWLRDAVERGDRLMGFGHRVYKTDDPRSVMLRGVAEQLGGDTSSSPSRSRPRRSSVLAELKPGPAAVHERRVLRRHRDGPLRPPPRDVHADVRVEPRRSAGARTSSSRPPTTGSSARAPTTSARPPRNRSPASDARRAVLGTIRIALPCVSCREWRSPSRTRRVSRPMPRTATPSSRRTGARSRPASPVTPIRRPDSSSSRPPTSPTRHLLRHRLSPLPVRGVTGVALLQRRRGKWSGPTSRERLEMTHADP